MSTDGYDINLDAEAPRLVAALLRADSWVAGFFGPAGIREHDDDEVTAWTPIPPYVAVLPGTQREQRTGGQNFRVTSGVRFRVYLPPSIPTVPSGAAPPAPVATVGTAGALSGSRVYRAWVYTGAGEFIHASTSKGVIRSRLDNVYWNSRYWQARRLTQ